MCNGRQLQHGCPLTLAKPREQNHLAVRKFQGIMVGGRFLEIDLPKAGQPLSYQLARENPDIERPFALDIAFEGDLRAGQQADRDIRLSYRGKSAGDGVLELRRHQLISDLNSSARDIVQTITSRGLLLFPGPRARETVGTTPEFPPSIELTRVSEIQM